jgi:hypothetical protein
VTLHPAARARLEGELGRVFLAWFDGEAAAARTRGDRERFAELMAFVHELAAGTGPVRDALQQREH